MTTRLQSSASYVRRMSDVRAWLRGLLKNSVHSATGSLLASIGTNGIEGMAPPALHAYVDGIGMNFSQAVAVFAVSLGIGALRYVNTSTAPGNTEPPFSGGVTQ